MTRGLRWAVVGEEREPRDGRLLQWEGLQSRPPAHAEARTEHYREKLAPSADAQREGLHRCRRRHRG